MPPPGNLPDRQFTGVGNLPHIRARGPGIVIVAKDTGDLTNGFINHYLITESHHQPYRCSSREP